MEDLDQNGPVRLSTRTQAMIEAVRRFTNSKPGRLLASGLRPFAQLLEASGQVYRQASVFIAEVITALVGEDATVGGGGQDGVGQGAPDLPPVKPLAEFPSDAHYDGALRAELAWAQHVVAMGLSAREIRSALMEARDLAKKALQNVNVNMSKGASGKAMKQTRVERLHRRLWTAQEEF